MTQVAGQRTDVQRYRLLGLRAIMDGRGVGAAVLTSDASVAFYGGAGQGALVVTATGCVAIPVAQERFWPAVAVAVGSTPGVGYEGDHLTSQQVTQLSDALGQRRLICLAADIQRHRTQAAAM